MTARCRHSGGGIGAVVLSAVLVTLTLVGTASAATTATPTAAGGSATAAIGPEGGLSQVSTTEIQSGGTYKRGEILTVSNGVSPNEVVGIRDADSGSTLLTYQADANGVVTIDTAEAFGDFGVPVDLRAVDDSGDVDRSFTLVSGEIEASFDPPSAKPGSGAEFVVREVVGTDDVRIRSDQLTQEELAEFFQHDPVFTMPSNGQEIIEFEVPDGDWAPPGEYEFTVENLATGQTARAVFQIEGTETRTTVPPDTGEFSLLVEPRETEYGGQVEIIIQGGTPDSRAAILVGDLGPEQAIELFPTAEIAYNGSYDAPTVPLNEEGQWSGVLRVNEDLFAAYEDVYVSAEDLGSGADSGMRFDILRAETTAPPGDEEVVTTTRPEVDPQTTTAPSNVVTEPDTPVRGFFINGDEGPLAPIANMLNLTMIGFLLSVVGILYQLMEGR